MIVYLLKTLGEIHEARRICYFKNILCWGLLYKISNVFYKKA